MFDYSVLYRLANEIDASWEERESINWSEAEQLIRLCKGIPADVVGGMPEICAIISHADEHEDWDCGIAGLWPASIAEELDSSDKTYRLESCGDNWKVVSCRLSGLEEWVANVETEALGDMLLGKLGTSSTVVPNKQVSIGVNCDNMFSANIPTSFSCVMSETLSKRIINLAGSVELLGVCSVEDWCNVGDWGGHEIEEGDDLSEESDYRVELEMLHVSKDAFWFTALPKHGADDMALSTGRICLKELYRYRIYTGPRVV